MKLSIFLALLLIACSTQAPQNALNTPEAALNTLESAFAAQDNALYVSKLYFSPSATAQIEQAGFSVEQIKQLVLSNAPASSTLRVDHIEIQQKEVINGTIAIMDYTIHYTTTDGSTPPPPRQDTTQLIKQGDEWWIDIGADFEPPSQ